MSTYNGGGFFASPGYGSQSSPGGRQSAGTSTLRPVTIKQLLGVQHPHADASYLIDGVEVHQVSLVATIYSINRQTTQDTYVLDDGTGRFEGKQWLDKSEDDYGRRDGIRENVYVKVIGSLRSFGGKTHLNITSIFPITHPNEIDFHIAEAVAATLYYIHGPLGNAGHTTSQSTQSNAYQSGGGGGNNDTFADLPPLERSIVNFILNSAAGDQGVHVSAISRGVNSKDAKAIMNAIDRLMDDGHIFSTIDENHFNVST